MPVSALFDQAVAHHRAGRLPQAGKLYEQVLAAEPGHVEALHHYGLIAHEAGRPDALGLLRRSVAARPDHAPYLNNLGIALYQHGLYDEAAGNFRRAIACGTGYPDPHFNLAVIQLLTGNFQEGLRGFERRWEMPGLAPFRPNTPWPRWDGGGGARGRRLLLHGEQGLGDVIQFARYVPLAARRAPGARLTILCGPPVEALLRRSLSPYGEVVSALPVHGFDLHCPLLSLPLLLGTTAETIPADVPYLSSARRETKQWRERLAADRGFRVGLVWAGSRTHLHDRRRSLPLAVLEPLGAVPGIIFYSLQKGEVAWQAAMVPGLRLKDFSGEWQNFDDTAAFVANLDLVISVDTAVAHLAGAMGKPVWLLTPFSPDWRWQLAREDSPWYPTMRLFRQAAPGRWDEAIARAAGALDAARSGPRV